MQQGILTKILAFIIVMLFASSNIIPIAESTFSEKMGSTGFSYDIARHNQNLEKKEGQKPPVNGPAPRMKQSPTSTKTGNIHPMLPNDVGNFYAFNVYDPNGMQPGPVRFSMNATVNLIAPSWNFISGSDFAFAYDWYAVCYYGGLYYVDFTTGEMTFIADTIPLDSLVLDWTTGTWYCCGYDNSYVDSLFTIDITTGATTEVGNFDAPNLMISLMVDSEGHMYAYDVLYDGNSHLYSIDKTTGHATVVGDMGHDFCYAQEGKFDLFTDTLYLTAYDIGMEQSYLATCDPETAEVAIINQFSPWDIDIDALGIPGYCLYPGVGVKKIIAPVSGNAQIITPEITIENYGWYDIDNVPVNMTIVKNQYTGYMNEHFNESTFPPAGWSNLATSDCWVQSPDIYAGGASPEAVLWYYNNYGGSGSLQSPYFITTSATSLKLSFQSCIYWWGGPCNCTVEITGDGGITWHDISPWANPIARSQGKRYTIDISAYIGTQTAVRFTYSGQYSWLYFWALDDVIMFDQIVEYNQSYYTDVPAGTIMNITLPDWTPADLGVAEGVTLEYIMNATTKNYGRPNFYKQKTFTLHFGYPHDVGIAAIVSPQSGLAQTQPVEVSLANNGQNNENVSMNVIIGKGSYNLGFTEDFSSGVPPPGWGTDNPTNWISSATDYAGGTTPEAEYSWTPQETGEFHLYTPPINTSGWKIALLKFKEYVSDYNSLYTLKIQTSIDNGTTWNDAYKRAGGAYGPQTTTITLGASNGVGLNNLRISWTFSGNNHNINDWYIDDVWFGQINIDTEYDQTVNVSVNTGASTNVTLPDWTPADVPLVMGIDYLIDASVSMNVSDGNPVDNELIKLITLSYEHDVGVTKILEPSQPVKDDLIWDNGPHTTNALSSQLDTAYPFNSQVADDFMFDDDMDVTEVSFDGMFWNGGAINPIDLKIIFYADDGSGNQPTGAGMDDPTSTALFVETHTAVNGTHNGDGSYHYDITLETWFVAEENIKYWFVAQFVGNYPPQWGICVSASQQLHNCMQGFPAIGIPYWTDPTYGDVSFQLMGHIHYVPPPGTFEIKAIVQNLGVTYPESTIPVEARVTHVDNNTVVYDYLKIIPGPLAPGNTTIIQFPDVYLEYLTAWEGTYLVEVWTALPGDDHPENDLKSTFYYHWIHDVLPPITNHTLEGTMGQNDWYVSDVHVTITAYDPFPPLKLGPKPPSGVNHTYYKLHTGDPWTEYTQDFNVVTDGTYDLYYYSVDKTGNAESVKGPFTFKIDKTAPMINLTAIPLNPLKTRWRFIINASDNGSGLAKIEIYIDEAFVGNISSPPWVFEYEGEGETAQVIAYDNAGNSAASNRVKNEGLSFVSQVMAQSIVVSVQERNFLYS
jgi:hypothetical protein